MYIVTFISYWLKLKKTPDCLERGTGHYTNNYLFIWE